MTQDKAFSDFWLTKEAIYQYVPDSKSDQFSLDLIQLASYRRLVSNFIYILTKKDIAVQFCTNKKSQLSFTDGNIVYLSASIQRKSDFDWSVGIALHEGSHILLTDFDLVKTMFGRIPMPVPVSLHKKADEKNVDEEDIYELIKWVWNFVEDRYIDSFTFKEAPGYRGYYKAMYNKFWNNKVISKALKSKKAYRGLNMFSYQYRVINLTNPSGDLEALPGLQEIFNLVDLPNMLRLKKTTDRLDLAYQVAEIILNNIEPLPDKPKKDTGEESDKTVNDLSKKLKEMVDKAKKNNQGSPQPSKPEPDKGENGEGGEKKKEENAGIGDKSEFTDDELKELHVTFNDLKDFLNHDYSKIKESVSEEQKAVLDAIEKSGITLVPSGFGMQGDYTQAAVDCVVVRKMTKDLVIDPITFPYSGVSGLKWVGDCKPPKECEDAVTKGVQLGKLLGKKLQIRAEEKITKFIRKPTGKIERRLLSDIGCGLEDIFNKIHIEKYNKARLHISVDASGSMNTMVKWGPTMTCLVAICVAASMVENLSISVSFRSTIHVNTPGGNPMLGGGTDLPYIVLAYDSSIDKISKIKTLFPFLRANGATPEGLAFEAIADEFIIGRKTTETDHYFLNISDGEPAYLLSAKDNKYGIAFDYSGEAGALHTKKQVDRIKSHRVKVLSYFISSGQDFSNYIGGLSFDTDENKGKKRMTLKEQFQLMYGKDAQFIDIQNVTDIARTVNRLFLSKV